MKKLTIGIIAHVDSGKTTLSEALLFSAGAIRKFGRVDKGESFLDGNSMERKRGITIFSKPAVFDWNETTFTLIDTPGHGDFSAEMERTLQVLDYAIFMISGADGIRGQSSIMWKLLAEYEIPTFIFVNKMDRDGVDKVRTLLELRKNFSDSIVEFGDGAFGKSTKAQEEFFDRTAMCSEQAMNEFLESGKLSDETISGLIADRMLFPCFFGSALKNDGVSQLLDGLSRWTAQTIYPQEFGARVYKIFRDENGKRLTLMKITGGQLKAKDMLESADSDEEAKVNQIRIYSGSKFNQVPQVDAGDVCAIDGLKESFAGQGFGYEDGVFEPLIAPEDKYAVIFENGEDPVKEFPSFKILNEESPEIKACLDEEIHEISLYLMGTVQAEILVMQIKERFKLSVHFEPWEEFARKKLELMWAELAEDELFEESEPEYDEDEEEKVGISHLNEILLGTEEIDAIIARISRTNEKNKSSRPGWKKKKRTGFGMSDEAAAEYRKSQQVKVFDPESADYMLIDGYNVIFAWDDLKEISAQNVEAARDSLLEIVSTYRTMTECEIIVVFDAYKVPGQGHEINDYKNIHVVYTKEAETADRYIERFANANGRKYNVTVVTSDGLEQVIIRGAGCALISSREFRERIDARREKLRERFGVKLSEND